MVDQNTIQEIDRLVEEVDTLVSGKISAKKLSKHIGTTVEQFGNFAKNGLFSEASKTKEHSVARKCLLDSLNDFIGACAELCTHSQEDLAVTGHAAALKAILVKGKYAHEDIVEDTKQVAFNTLRSSTDILLAWEGYMRYDDVRYHFLNAVAAFHETEKVENTQSLLDTLQVIDSTLIAREDKNIKRFYCGKPTDIQARRLKNSSKGSMLKASSQREAFRRAWIAALRCQLNMAQIKEVLSVMHAKIIPNMDKPQLLMDFLTDAYNYGGSISLLALNALFELIQYHGLDYPKFYRKLYSLLEDGSILVSSHRARFFRLLDLFLSSSHLPATIPASIMKRLARLTLYAPPGAIVAVIPFVYNQLKRHPTCMLMIHRENPTRGAEADPFDPEEKDPQLTKAIESSLWELDAMTRHYHPNVAAIAKIFSQPFNKPSYQLEHFLVHSYETLIDTENRRTGLVPTLEFEEIELYNDEILSSWTL